MVATALLRNDVAALRAIADEVASRLAFAKSFGNDVFIQTPVLFPSGRSVGVKILGGPELFTVTDDGATMREAEMLGAEDIGRREAKKAATEFDLKFNDWELFEASANADRLVGTVAIVANAAAMTMVRTSDKFAERFAIRHREELSVRLARIFGSKNVERDFEYSGAARSWSFDSRVTLPSGREGLFAVVTPAPVSVAFAYSKLDDVSRVENPPFLAAVLEDGVSAGDRTLLSRPARRIFTFADPDERFRAAA